MLITGCSSGFRLLSAVEFARRGHRVFVTMRDLGRADRLRAAADDADVAVDALHLDVRDEAGVARQSLASPIDTQWLGFARR